MISASSGVVFFALPIVIIAFASILTIGLRKRAQRLSESQLTETDFTEASHISTKIHNGNLYACLDFADGTSKELLITTFDERMLLAAYCSEI